MQERRRVLSGGGSLPGAIDGSDAKELDVVFSKNDGSELVIISGLENWPDSGYTPIGIVVVPGTHNRYEDGSCGVMSLVLMDPNNLTTGIPVNSLLQVDVNNTFLYTLSGLYVDGVFMSGDKIINNTSSWVMPFLTNSESTVCSVKSYLPIWPYTNLTYSFDGSFVQVELPDISTEWDNNGSYVNETTGNAALDMNGVRNTYNFWAFANNDLLFKLYLTLGRQCAMELCSKFKTVGANSFIDVFGEVVTSDPNCGTSTSTKDNKNFWYMPALGELCYIPPRRFEINKVLIALNLKYGYICTTLSTSSSTYVSYVSSSASDRYSIYYICNQERPYLFNAREQCIARAFMRL